MTWKEFKSFIKSPWKIKKQMSLYSKVLFSDRCLCFDEFMSKDFSYHDYEMFLIITKHYTLSGIRYSVEIPSCSISGDNLFKVIWEAINHLDKNSPGYGRLKDHMMTKDLWRKI
jgi:hypothetical protein